MLEAFCARFIVASHEAEAAAAALDDASASYSVTACPSPVSHVDTPLAMSWPSSTRAFCRGRGAIAVQAKHQKTCRECVSQQPRTVHRIMLRPAQSGIALLSPWRNKPCSRSGERSAFKYCEHAPPTLELSSYQRCRPIRCSGFKPGEPFSRKAYLETTANKVRVSPILSRRITVPPAVASDGERGGTTSSAVYGAR